jgi:hypothetical protein
VHQGVAHGSAKNPAAGLQGGWAHRWQQQPMSSHAAVSNEGLQKDFWYA